jgi:hypothetical protein
MADPLQRLVCNSINYNEEALNRSGERRPIVYLCPKCPPIHVQSVIFFDPMPTVLMCNGHGMQLVVVSVSGLNEFIGHIAQNPSVSLYHPAVHRHSEKNIDPSVEFVPAGHVMQFGDVPYAPALHITVQNNAAYSLVFLPNSHAMHSVGPVAFLYAPGSHCEQATPFDTAVCPARHVQSVNMVLPVAEVVFTGHDLQVFEIFALKVPGAHAEHIAAVLLSLVLFVLSIPYPVSHSHIPTFSAPYVLVLVHRGHSLHTSALITASSNGKQVLTTPPKSKKSNAVPI